METLLSTNHLFHKFRVVFRHCKPPMQELRKPGITRRRRGSLS